MCAKPTRWGEYFADVLNQFRYINKTERIPAPHCLRMLGCLDHASFDVVAKRLASSRDNIVGASIDEEAGSLAVKVRVWTGGDNEILLAVALPPTFCTNKNRESSLGRVGASA